MTAIAEKLDRKLKSWPQAQAAKVESLVTEIIDLADQDGLDLLRSRQVEQDVLDLLDETETG